jgi:hypothetical protein
LGRFLSPDSVQPDAPGTQGLNLYSYVANNPATNTDPTGHELSYAFLSRVFTPIILAGLAYAIRFAIVASLTILLAVLLEPAAEEAVRDINKEAEDIYNKIMGKPKPKPCVDTECFPIPPLKPTPRPDRCRAGSEAVPGLVARAESIREVELGTPAYYLRAVADLRVRKHDDQTCLDIIGAGAQDLTPRQRTAVEGLIAPPAIWAKLSDRHAEVTALNAARLYGSPLALGVTFTICTEESKRSDTCRLDITGSGGIITPDQHGAYWPANNL